MKVKIIHNFDCSESNQIIITSQ